VAQLRLAVPVADKDGAPLCAAPAALAAGAAMFNLSAAEAVVHRCLCSFHFLAAGLGFSAWLDSLHAQPDFTPGFSVFCS
jgi:hypothetical protein